MALPLYKSSDKILMMLVGGDNMSERDHDRMEQVLQRWKNPYQTYKITVGQKLVPFDLEAV
jgi:hypothetical protein